MAASLHILYFKQGKRNSPEDFTQNISNYMLLSNFLGIGKDCCFVTAVRSLSIICLLIARVQSFGKDCFSAFSVKMNLMITLNVKERTFMHCGHTVLQNTFAAIELR